MPKECEIILDVIMQRCRASFQAFCEKDLILLLVNFFCNLTDTDEGLPSTDLELYAPKKNLPPEMDSQDVGMQ